MFKALIGLAALSLIAACSSSAADDTSSAETAESAVSACGDENESCCHIFEPGQSGFSMTYCTNGLTCSAAGGFEKCITPGAPPAAGPPASACGFEGHHCCPSTAVGEDGDHAPRCNVTLTCRTVSGVATCVDPLTPSPLPAPALCGTKGKRCCPSPDVGESGSHAATCEVGLACTRVGSRMRCE